MPVQHSPAEAQVVPLPEQLVAWQVPLVQKVEQHCEPALQLAPLAEQVPPLVVVEDLEQPWARRATAEAVAKSREVRRRMDGPSIYPARRSLGGLSYHHPARSAISSTVTPAHLSGAVATR